ncbi:unnamed protein product [marine sediment metagenome]|uniref:Uncharacterized protein n=1 Tax=marine sediment metagenome TaxID=412755 RepID=X1PXK8_9ZZZZ
MRTPAKTSKPGPEDAEQLCFPRWLHGRTNMESGIISLYEQGATPLRIAATFRTTLEAVNRILISFGYKE